MNNHTKFVSAEAFFKWSFAEALIPVLVVPNSLCSKDKTHDVLQMLQEDVSIFAFIAKLYVGE